MANAKNSKPILNFLWKEKRIIKPSLESKQNYRTMQKSTTSLRIKIKVPSQNFVTESQLSLTETKTRSQCNLFLPVCVCV